MFDDDLASALRVQRAVLRGLRAISALYGLDAGLEDDASHMRASIAFAGGVALAGRAVGADGAFGYELVLGAGDDRGVAVVSGAGRVSVSSPGSAWLNGVMVQVADALRDVAEGPMAVGVLFARVVPAVVHALGASPSSFFEDELGAIIFVGSGGALQVRGAEVRAWDEERAGLTGEDLLPDAPSGFLGRSRFKVFDPSERSFAKRRSVDSEMEDEEFFRQGDDGYRTLSPFTRGRAAAVSGLRDAAPHLSALWDEVEAMANAASLAHVPLTLDPLVVLGPPGIGKTWAINRMREALGLEGEIISMAGTTLNEVIQGGHPSWKGASPGLVAKMFAKCETANPLVCVDEFDKITTHQWRGDPFAPYYALLEPEGSTTFVDEFLSVHFQTRHVSWLFTANDVRVLPDMIADRVKVIEVSRPDRDQMRRMALAMVMAAHERYGGWFSGSPPADDVLDELSALTPRRSRLVYSSAMAAAVADGRRVVLVGDLPVEKRARGAGFLSGVL